jgi:hypothetical protein
MGRGLHRSGLLAVTAVGLFGFCCAHALGQAFSDYEVKAAYFYKFSKFVEWPKEVFTSPAAPIRFCVLRDHSFETELNRVVKGKSIPGHDIEVIGVGDGEQARRCQLLFINSIQQRESRHIIEALRGASVLTVGETGDFLQQGGMIAFVLDHDRVQFEVNRKAASDARLFVSSKMLSLAKRVVD